MTTFAIGFSSFDIQPVWGNRDSKKYAIPQKGI